MKYFVWPSLIHLLLIAAYALYRTPESKHLPTQVHVHTVYEAPKKEEVVVRRETPPKQVIAQAPPKKKVPTKKSTPAKKVAPQTTASRAALIGMLEESLGKLTHEEMKYTPQAHKTASLKSAPVSSTDYISELTAYLEEQLTLPEKGEVRLKLTLSSVGHYVASEVISAPSSKNERYVKEEVTHLIFPPFTGNMKGKSQHTFSLTLRGS